MLHGREIEQARLASLLDDADHGRAGVLVLRGEPGVGKSALLDDLVAGAGYARVLRTQGLESESPLAFAALHRLLRPVLTLDKLPAPQARALRVAFGLEDGPAVEPFLVAVATLSTLTEAAEQTSVLCLVDDAHWLDAASADALLFTARRLQADRVAMVFTARDAVASPFTPDGVPSLLVTGLDAAAARSLLAEHAVDPLSDDACTQLLDQTGGNPLALMELPRGLTDAQRRGTEPMPRQLHLTATVERAFLDRCRRLPVPVQSLLLLAAADDSGRTATVREAAESRGIPASALHDAERSELLVLDGPHLQVRHPLVRSAIYQAATSLERQEAHRAIADALAGDDDRQAWHRAAAAARPDAEVVAALERAAHRAERRGGYVAASAAFERAAELSATEHARSFGLAAAARNAWACGQTARARFLAARARERTDDRLLYSDIDRLRGRIEVNTGSAAEAHRIFTRAARAVAADDPVRALDMAVAASLLRIYGADSGTSLDMTTVPTVPSPGDTPRARCLTQLLASATAADEQDWATAATALQSAIRTGADLSDPDLLGNLGNAALHIGDDDAHRRCFTTMLSDARETSAAMTILYALPRLAFTQWASGHWSVAGSAAQEALSLSSSLGLRPLTAAPLAWLTVLAALRGGTEYDVLLARTEDVSAHHSLGVMATPVCDLLNWARGVRAAHAGDARSAFRYLRLPMLPAIGRMTVIDRVESAVRADDREQAAAWVEQLASFADATRWPWALAAVDHGRALLARPTGAPDLFQKALAHHARGGRPYDEARTHLAYGELLRRSQRRVDARTHLRHALEIFENLRAEPQILRAAQELRSSGETARRRDPSTTRMLTPMELHVAQLVSKGMSNKEVATQCWISPRTVAFHLRNCFSKTGVASRGELAQIELG